MAQLSRKWIPGGLAAFLVLSLAGALIGCGGGGGSTTPTTVAGAAPAAPAAAVSAAAATAAAAEPTVGLVGTKVTPTPLTPKEVRTALKEHRPMVVLFYVKTSVDDDTVKSSLERLKPRYPDALFLLYDYSNAKVYGDMAQQLKVNYPPQTMFIDAQGVVGSFTSGYADYGTLQQKVVNVTQE
jgi:hypothetical protein